MIGDLGDNGAWAVFNYTLDDKNAQGEASQTRGAGTIVYSKNGTSLRAVLIQLSVNGKAITAH